MKPKRAATWPRPNAVGRDVLRRTAWVPALLASVSSRLINRWKRFFSATPTRIRKSIVTRLRLIFRFGSHIAFSRSKHAFPFVEATPWTGARHQPADLVSLHDSWCDPSRSGESPCSDPRITQFGRLCDTETPAGQAPDSRFYLSRQTREVGKHKGLARSIAARRRRQGIPLAFSSAHLGELACAIRYAHERAAGNGRMGVSSDGASLRSSLASAVRRRGRVIARLLRGTNLAQRASRW